MLKSESQVRLSIELQGRLGATASNASTKKERRKWLRSLKLGYKLYTSKYKEPERQFVKQSLLINSSAVQFYISNEGRPMGCSPSNWKKKNARKRLEEHLQIIADSISMKSDTKFTYSIID